MSETTNRYRISQPLANGETLRAGFTFPSYAAAFEHRERLSQPDAYEIEWVLPLDWADLEGGSEFFVSRLP